MNSHNSFVALQFILIIEWNWKSPILYSFSFLFFPIIFIHNKYQNNIFESRVEKLIKTHLPALYSWYIFIYNNTKAIAENTAPQNLIFHPSEESQFAYHSVPQESRGSFVFVKYDASAANAGIGCSFRVGDNLIFFIEFVGLFIFQKIILFDR